MALTILIFMAILEMIVSVPNNYVNVDVKVNENGGPPGVDKDDCPESEGFFKMSGPSKKCYKFDNSAKITFTVAQQRCVDEGAKLGVNLRLAEVEDAITLRSHIVQTYGGDWTKDEGACPWTWVNAKGNNKMFQWQISGVTMQKYNPLFWGFPNAFPSPVTSEYCLVLLTEYYNFGEFPTSPYFYVKCDASYYTLCEKY